MSAMQQKGSFRSKTTDKKTCHANETLRRTKSRPNLGTFAARVAASVLMLATVCAGSPAIGQNFQWGPAPIDNVWHNILNWSPFGFPAQSNDKATIDNVTNGLNPTLFANAIVGELTVRPGGVLYQNGYNLIVNTHVNNQGMIDASGITCIELGGAIVVEAGSGAFDTDELDVGGLFESTGFVQVDKRADIRPSGEFKGTGTLQMAGADDLVNNGVIEADGGILLINRLGNSALFKADGDSVYGENGELKVSNGGHLIIDMPILSQFNGSINVNESGYFQLNTTMFLGSLATINFENSGHPRLIINGALIFNNSYEVGGLQGTGSLTVNTNHTLGIGKGLSSSTFSGSISGNGGVHKIGTGVSTLAGESTYSGNTTVSSGTLRLTNSSGSATGTGSVFLTGSGALSIENGRLIGDSLSFESNTLMQMTDGLIDVSTLQIAVESIFVILGGQLVADDVEGNLEMAGGTLVIGDSPGLLTINGDFDQQSDACLEIELGGVDPGSQYDQLMVTGDVSLAGSLDVQILEPFLLEPGQQFTIVEATGDVTGAFADLMNGDLVGTFDGVDLFISYDDNSVSLFTVADVVPGDVNLDGDVNLLDVAPFVDRVSSGTFQAEADINQDGSVNLLDVAPFVALMAGG